MLKAQHMLDPTMEDTSHQYSTLGGPKSIRVLLLSGGSANQLFAELIETTLGDNIPFEAISYVWGNSTKSRRLALRGGTTLKITESLYNALRSIRHSLVEDGSRAVWADGVCINQEDLDERSQQVRLMAEIYHSAHRVITYVGEDAANVERGIGLAEKLILCSKELNTYSTPAVVNSVYHKYNVPNRYDPAWPSLRDFLCRPWYTRMWIIQESLQNSNMLMMCGNVAMPWKLFTQLNTIMEEGAYNQFSAITPYSERQQGAMGQMARLRVEFRQRPISFLELLVSSRDLECSDPRDRVFALSSLLKDGGVDPDYTKSAPRVFTEAAVVLLSSYGTVVLSYAGINRSTAVPSWVPDWSKPMEQIPVYQCRHFNSSGPTAMVIQGNDLASGSLHLLGKIYDRIVHVTDTLRRVFVTSRMARFAWASDQYWRLTSSGSAYPGGGSYLEAFWRTVISDLDPKDRQGSSAPALLAQKFEAYVRPDTALAKWEASVAFPEPSAPAWQ
jgi:hypothetical protein